MLVLFQEHINLAVRNIIRKYTKQGNKFIRWSLIESTQTAKRLDPALYAFYEKLKRTKGSGVAIVAVARKLYVSVYHILKNGEPYKYNSLSKIPLKQARAGFWSLM